MKQILMLILTAIVVVSCSSTKTMGEQLSGNV